AVINNLSLHDALPIFVYQSGEENPQIGYFNPNAVELQNLSLQINNVFLRENQAKLNLNRFSFEETSGFALQEFKLGLAITNNNTQLSGLSLITNRSQLAGDATVGYASLEELMSFPERSNVDLGLQLKADLRDAYFFSPDLARDTVLSKAAQHPVLADLEVDGSLELLTISGVDIQWGKATQLNAQGTVSHPMRSEERRVGKDCRTIKWNLKE